jgi:hypothetical protein
MHGDEEEWPVAEAAIPDEPCFPRGCDEMTPMASHCPNVKIVDASEFIGKLNTSDTSTSANKNYQLKRSASLRGRRAASNAIRNKRDFISSLMEENQQGAHHNAKFGRSHFFNTGMRRNNSAKRITNTEKMIQYLSSSLKNNSTNEGQMKMAREQLLAQCVAAMNLDNGLEGEAPPTDRISPQSEQPCSLADARKLCHSATRRTTNGDYRRDRVGSPRKGSTVRSPMGKGNPAR